jgi:2'-5' RNA ligase
MTESVLRSALVVTVPEAGRSIEQWREPTCSDKPSIGISAHVTLLFPFVPAPEIDDRLIAELSALFREFESFDFELREARRWPEMSYLAPEPPEPFVDRPKQSSLDTRTTRRTKACSIPSSRT